MKFLREWRMQSDDNGSPGRTHTEIWFIWDHAVVKFQYEIPWLNKIRILLHKSHWKFMMWNGNGKLKRVKGINLGKILFSGFPLTFNALRIVQYVHTYVHMYLNVFVFAIKGKMPQNINVILLNFPFFFCFSLSFQMFHMAVFKDTIITITISIIEMATIHIMIWLHIIRYDQ